jgi:pimeloyl-ACP methyl ester carboxylesterase
VYVEVDGARLEVRRWPGAEAGAPLVLLHEGLGSVSTWRDFPAALANRTQSTVVAYSRAGYGGSTVVTTPRDTAYMHHEAAVVLPELLERLGIERPILFGHSDGASIALIFAGRYPDGVAALVLEAPHVFVEDVTVASIARIGAAYAEDPRLRSSLERHHADADATFNGWNRIWLDPAFRTWSIENELDAIRAPALVIQGRDDEYGTFAQVDAIAAHLPSVEVASLERCGHAPHRDARETVLERVASFLSAARV